MLIQIFKSTEIIPANSKSPFIGTTYTFMGDDSLNHPCKPLDDVAA